MSMATISNYFTPLEKQGEKRPFVPSSAESSNSATPACKKTLMLNSPESSPGMNPIDKLIADNSSSSQVSPNTMNQTQTQSSDIDTLKQMILGMQQTLSNLATKDDVEQVRKDCNKVFQRVDELSKKVEDSIGKFESRIHDVEVTMDKIVQENIQLKQTNVELNDKLSKQEQDINDLQQYSRRRNLRVFNMKKEANEISSIDTEKKVCDAFTSILGVDTNPDMVEACHRVPWSGNPPKFKDGKTRPEDIIIQFKSRKDRDRVFASKSKCKDQGFSIGEDLTAVNAKLCQAVHKHSAFMSSWSTGGKIRGKLKNSKVIAVPVGTNLDELAKKHM